jgi:hypothetical protein
LKSSLNIEIYSVLTPDNSNYHYFYFVNHDENKLNTFSLGRVVKGSIQNSNLYEYWDGFNYDKDIKNSEYLIPPDYWNPQLSVFYNKYLKLYIMLLSNFFERSIYLSYSTDLNTEFSKPIVIYKDDNLSGGIYCVYVRELLFEENGKIMYLTFSYQSETGFTNPKELKIIIS